MRCRARLPSCASASHARATGTASLRWGRCRCNDRTIRRARGSHAAVAEQEREPCGEDGEASSEPNTPSASTSHLFSCILMKNKAIVNITPRHPGPLLFPLALRLLALPSLSCTLACFMSCCRGAAVVAAACLFVCCVYWYYTCATMKETKPSECI
jgi:hypothetical protein